MSSINSISEQVKSFNNYVKLRELQQSRSQEVQESEDQSIPEEPFAGRRLAGDIKSSDIAAEAGANLSETEDHIQHQGKTNYKQLIDDLKQLVEEVEKGSVQSFKRDLEFEVNEDGGRTVILVIDTETNEVIRKIPPEDLIEKKGNLEALRGVLYDQLV